MNGQRTLDVSHLPPYHISNHAPLFWGQIMLACIEGTMFLILVACYYYFRQRMDIWPGAGVQLPHVTLPTLALLPLLVSCAGSYYASESAKKGERMGMLVGLALNLLPAILFLALIVMEWRNFNFKWSTDAHGSVVWTMLGLFTLDAFADLCFTAVLILLILLGHDGPKQRLGAHVDSIIWYFIALIWIPLYVTIFWGPRIVGAP
jgi:heme/copper-type cytochrome/quinol oxidase subunit 3